PWIETTLYTFTGGADGAQPWSSLTLDAAGNLYGTAEMGGTNSSGVVFELTPTASGPWTETGLHSFTGADGKHPRSGVLFDPAGNLYGSTYFGVNTFNCPPNGCGVIYKLTHTAGGWTQTLLHTFDGNDGAFPSELIRDASGNLYGTAINGSIGF